ncbi:TPA: type-F conjugative transfer system secretin TraK [Legionella pneumophila]|uniref:Type-F conjugative transfer system secretin TraK n=1 Tax=Legionella pneumophila subsp. pneumophila TaxID=91891 RepID=A0A3A6UKA8_LEGPN|nr:MULTISPECIES: type-F conjugative transfer system secretin TraK [Legionella]HAT7809682.1 type-F conjugative transfer system secretin TraK [Legionella pneumophila]MBN5936155.1 type-F conjugative transfer system secretin TraK [Legionella anisa]RJY24221.1 type-F conjugative transfer system secretin TraK [Legionella pneumophila subsp. pneumophila]RJY24669.1 type-F conjugative transfer system secretin TraK [Legionella pneumophila subsp. pneumophila]HAT7819312.1 type-F conjugative transfer system 
MRKPISIALTLLSTLAIGANSIPVKDNSDIALTLSQGNYNRLVVKNDKIMEAVFPPNAMAIKRDEQDGSVYVMLSAANPFTLFLTTENGRHFSVTLNGEESLGKTIELVPSQPMVAATRANATKTNPKTINQEAVPEAILAMLTHMEQQKPFADVSVKRQFGKVERWSKGLTLLPKELWDGKLLKGETIELYNGGKEPLELAQEWFAKEGTLAIKFSKPSLAPGEKAMLYRVQGVNHG